MNNENSTTTIMVVDDTPANLKLLDEMLQSRGYRVVQFPRGAMALKAAAQNPPDLILLDILMPEMDGFEVCRRLKSDESLKDIPVLFISALDGPNDKIKAFSAGGLDYVTKPFQEEEVLARVKTHLDLRRQQLQVEVQKRQIQEDYDRLRELEELRDNLVHMIVHDMRSPLMGVLGYAELLVEELKNLGHDELATYAGEILATGGSLRDMVTTLLDISRMESNEMPLEKEACDLREIVASAIISLGALVNDSTVLFERPADAVVAVCDPEVVRRVVGNLIANAVKFTGSGGEVRIDLNRISEGVGVTFCDNGPGIPPEYYERIFDKFGQMTTSKEGHKYSTGLGLTFCKLAVEAQGGRIGVDSEVGKGSIFWFILPAAG
ncbi:MAG: response regulator [Desulfobacterales bacterium]|nr:response regulator [Desulfobacterales bacterium]